MLRTYGVYFRNPSSGFLHLLRWMSWDSVLNSLIANTNSKYEVFRQVVTASLLYVAAPTSLITSFYQLFVPLGSRSLNPRYCFGIIAFLTCRTFMIKLSLQAVPCMIRTSPRLIKQPGNLSINSFANTAIKLRVPQKVGYCLNVRGYISSTQRTMFRGVGWLVT
jgi:hypothetical protein